MDLKKIDWNKIQGYFSPQAMNDLNDMLEKMPQTAGQGILIVAGISWSFAAAIGLFTTIQVQNLTELRAELAETRALQPVVPVIRDVPVSKTEVKDFVEDLKEIYPDLLVKQQGASIFIGSRETSYFGQFREAVGHVQNGGKGWRVTMEKLCVGRECKTEQLGVMLRINKVSVDKAA